LKFLDALSVILEEPAQNDWHSSHIEQAMAIIKKTDMVRQQLLDLQNDLVVLKNSINGDLALNVKKKEPGMSINLNADTGCKIGCFDKSVSVNPNFDDMKWDISCYGDEEFADGLCKHCQDQIIITHDINPFVEAILSYFTNYGRQIGESIHGQGILIIEGRLGKLSDLAKWRYEKGSTAIKMPSRLARRI